jgi:RHS repeat-associated protein
VRRSVDPAGTPPAVIEHYALEGGRRALTLNSAGNVVRRYAHAPSGEVLVDQAFATTGAETQLTTPLADHQGSPRILYGGASHSAPAVRQSVDYAPFGRVTEIRDAAGQVTTSALDAAFGHHGSLVDPKTGLQYKSEGSDGRWYSPDLGRFVSVDPIQDGSNWYAFAGNDPINQSDPTGLRAEWTDPRNTLSSTHRNLIASQPLTSPGYKLQSTSFDTSLRTSAGPSINATQQLGLASTRYTPYAAPSNHIFNTPPSFATSLSSREIQRHAANVQARNYMDALDWRQQNAPILAELQDLREHPSPQGPTRLFGETFVAPWNPHASGYSESRDAWLRGGGRAVAGTASGAISGAATGAVGGAALGAVTGPGAGITAGGGAAAGGLWGGVSGFLRAARSDTVYDAATGGAVDGAISGVFVVGGQAVGAARAASATRAARTTPLISPNSLRAPADVGIDLSRYVADNGIDLSRYVGTTYPEGSFSISNWAGYPRNVAVPRPQGPFRILEGEEYATSRAAATGANRAIHEENPWLAGLQIHEVQPVKFDGSPTSFANKVALSPETHAQFTTWWRALQKNITGR